MSGWSIPLPALAEKVKLDLDTVTRKATFDLFTAVILKTPVDSGRFRANWNCTKGTPDTSTSESTDESRAAQEAQKALAFGAGGVVYFVNALPYGPRLEYEGWSQQAPAGMVRVSIAEFDQYVKGAIA